MKEKLFRYSKLVGIALILGSYGILTAFGINKFDEWRVAESNKMLIESEKVTKNDSLLLLQKAAFLDPNEDTYLKTGLKAEELGLESLANTYFLRVKTANGYFELGQNFLNQSKYDKALEAYTKAILKQKDAKYYLARAKTYLKKTELDKARSDIQKSFGVETGEEARYFDFLTKKIAGEKVKVPELSGELKENVAKIESYTTPQNQVIVLYNELNTQNYPQLAKWYLKEQSKKDNLDRDGYLVLAKLYSEENSTRPQYEALLKAKSKDEFYPQTYLQLAETAKKLNLKQEANNYLASYSRLVW